MCDIRGDEMSMPNTEKNERYDDAAKQKKITHTHIERERKSETGSPSYTHTHLVHISPKNTPP